MDVYRRIRDKWIPESLPPPGTYDGKTVLVTGGTSGLGLAAAIQFAKLGANVIITCRSASRGAAAKEKILAATRMTSGSEKIEVTELDMSRYSSCVAFVESLKKNYAGQGGLDCVILNAGSATPLWTESPEGWEETVQVNTLNTALLALLLLPWMKEERAHRETLAHIVFVNSRSHLDADITTWTKWSEEGGILPHLSSKENWPRGELSPNYAESKLLLMYATEKICKLALGPDGNLQVIVNSLCPGLVRTDLIRSVVKHSLLMSYLVPLYFAMLSKSPEYGVRLYAIAGCSAPQDHGRFFISLFNNAEYQKKATPSITSENGRKVQKLVWEEIVHELKAKVPTVQIE